MRFCQKLDLIYMKTNIKADETSKTYKTFLGYVYGEARKSEIKDINGNTKSFIFKNCRIIFGIIISVGLLILVPEGFNDSFLQLISTMLSIFIGLFLTVLVFALDKFYRPNICKIGDYRVEITQMDRSKQYELSLDEIKYPNAQEKIFQKRSYNYLKQFVTLIGKCVVVSVWTLILVCCYVIFFDYFHGNIFDYICMKNWLIRFSVIVVVRFLISYFMVEIFYNTIKIISSMVNFMMAKLGKENLLLP